MRWRALLTHLNGAIEKKWKAGLANRNGAPSLFSTRTYCTGHHSSASGLYGLSKHLNGMDGFRQFFQYSLERAEKLVRHICEAESEKFSPTEVIGAFDGIFSIVDTFTRAANLCIATHPDRLFANRVKRPLDSMTQYRTKLLRNSPLYDAVKRLEKQFHTLSEEDQRFVSKLKSEFEKGGCLLCSEKRLRLDSLQVEISRLCGDFRYNIEQDPGNVDIYPSSRIPEDLGCHMERVYQSNEEEGFRIVTNEENAMDVLKHLPDEEIRKMVYFEVNSKPLGNIEVLRRFVSCLNEEAQMLECKSYGEAALRHTMASSVEVVRAFLTEMSDIVRAKSTEELRLLKKFTADGNITPWSETYYKQKVLDSYFPDLQSKVSSHLSMWNCIDGLNVIVQSLFGATIYRMDLAPGESWHDDVVKLSLHHPEEGDLGYIYLDLFSRADKSGTGGCTYPIRVARRISATEYELPIVAIVCHFPTSWDAVLYHDELEELFHEFGHTLHSLLSRTERQFLAGTQVAPDLLEVPSTLFEYYARDFRVLKRFARHDLTDEEIPQQLVELMQEERDIFYARKLQLEIQNSFVDQALFGESPFHGDINLVVRDLTRKHTDVEGAISPQVLRFDHFLDYTAVYYSYLYGECFAATIWKKLCEEDPLSRDVGSALRKFLECGGAKDPLVLLHDLIGHDAYIHCGSGIIPNISNLCDLRKL